jgi:RHH-type proline utilization regulon transcriptional repressor/proline dehydrogenase/delta 1-pyrroline-5-carboxylate dehydrogenase
MLKLLKRPEPSREAAAVISREAGPRPREFVNCPLTDFADPDAHARFADAVRDAPATFPRVVPVVVNGEARAGGLEMVRWCPSDTSIRVALVTAGQSVDADNAIAAALRAWPVWSAWPVRDRANALERLADRLEAERFELAALEVFEAGKPWREADADVVEAIDFCRYYARRALDELGTRRLGELPGEVNTLQHEGRGPTAVIAPWNFPIAILCGMSAAALVAGNPVVLKPAEQSSACGYALFQCMKKAGIPDDVAHFLPGLGEEIGGYLVEHPGVAMIAFTGSMKVGLSIIERAGKMPLEQPWVKSVVCEMGGKNAIIIDDDADLDEAVAGVVHSAFGYAGQKCSACSRVLVLEAVLEAFLNRLIEATRSLKMAPAHDPGCQMGPVIDEAAYERLLNIIATPGEGATCLYAGANRDGGHYVPPAIFRVKDPRHPLMQRELFGPILAIMSVKNFDEAVEVAMATPFALTGGVYSRDPEHLEVAAQRFRVGNLYFNRPCTGARVGQQPFGGFGMSGTGTKAGGPGYLTRFAVPRCITEKTTRKGFTPEVTM